MSGDQQFNIREANPDEFLEIGQLMVAVYSQLDGFPTPEQQPAYYQLLANIGSLTEKPNTKLLIAVSSTGKIGGAVIYFGDMQYYGSGGIATTEKNAAGFRLLAVDPVMRGFGLGKELTRACIHLAQDEQQNQVIIHSTKAMKVAWKMYEKMGFKRAEELDFKQGELQVYGFRLIF